MICLKPLQILHHIFCHQTNSSRRCHWITCMASQISSTTFLNGTIRHTTWLNRTLTKKFREPGLLLSKKPVREGAVFSYSTMAGRRS